MERLLHRAEQEQHCCGVSYVACSQPRFRGRRLALFAVGHSKFDPDRLFGAIRSAVHNQTVLSTPQLKEVIDSISGVESAVIFDGGEIRDWHGAMATFNAVPNIRKTFYYRIKISRVDEGVVVQLYDAPNALPTAHNLLKPGSIPPSLTDFSTMPFLPAPELSLKRRQDLEKNCIGLYLEDATRRA